MSNKYYICNEVIFLNGMCESATNPSSATHMKMSKAASIAANYPKYGIYKARNSSRGNDYVICTKMKFLGNDLNTVDGMGKAKVFNSVEDAYRYMDQHRDEIDKDICTVIDQRFSRKRRPSNVKEVVKDITPVDIFECREDVNSSERVYIPAKIRDEVYKKSNGVCAICGKALSPYTYTIDHIKPLSRGGTSELANLRATHEACNKLKGNFYDEELMNNIGDVMYNSVYSSPCPDSDLCTKFMRGLVRGVIKQYNNCRVIK